jgi:hypothetical protein
MAVEYSCEGCGVRVITLAVFRPPAHGFCIQCAFLCAYVPDPVEMVALRKALDADRREDDALVSGPLSERIGAGGGRRDGAAEPATPACAPPRSTIPRTGRLLTMSPLAVASSSAPLVHTDVDVDGRRCRVVLRDGEPVAVAIWIVEEFGPRAPHAYWRRVWALGRRSPGRVVRVAIAKAMAAPVVTLAVD